jgi:DNA-binding MarR family transcriptional regulator
MPDNVEITRERILLEQIENDPDITQASLATQLGVAVGTVNWHLKRMIAKGYVKVKRAERRKLRYIITPEGITFRARLTIDYIEQSFLLYRNIRKRVRELLAEVKQAGYDQVHIETETTLNDPKLSSQTNDIADVCRLTCLEQGIKISEDPSSPILMVRGVKVSLYMEGKS